VADKDQTSKDAPPQKTSRGIVVLLIAFAVLLLPPVFFCWTYIQHQVTYQTERDVGALDDVGRQFTTAVAAYGDIVKKYVDKGALDEFSRQVTLSVDKDGYTCFPPNAKRVILPGNPPVLTYAPHDAEALYLGYTPTEPVKGGTKKPPRRAYGRRSPSCSRMPERCDFSTACSSPTRRARFSIRTKTRPHG
jgi:hypothetical protein